RMPASPWQPAELRQVVEALTELSRTLTPSPVTDLPVARERLQDDLFGYRNLAAQPPADLDPWERRHLTALADLAASALDHIDGDTLVHTDLRTDNILLDGDGRVWFVDWPWACRGAQWLDTVLLQVNVALHGHDPERYLAGHPLLADVDP